MSFTPKASPFDVLLDTYLAELLEMTDEEVLEGEDPAEVQARGLRILDATQAQVGRRRLAAARELSEQLKKTEVSPPSVEITAADARAALRHAASANDGRYTLAARQLDEMADEDVIRAFLQLKELEDKDQRGTDGNAE